MCDPVTLAVAAGSAAGYGATVYGVGTVAAVGIGLTVGMGVMQYSALGEANKAQNKAYDATDSRLKTEMEQKNLKMILDSNKINKDYQKERAKMISTFAARGITLGGKSINAAFKSLDEEQQEDLSLAKLSNLESQTVTSLNISDNQDAKEASNQAYKSDRILSLFQTGRQLTGQVKELSGTKPSSKSNEGSSISSTYNSYTGPTS
tara:strand:- start:1236 stop:1853 length:618 start_codon:yes stop_codon:yes gene_type:complete